MSEANEPSTFFAWIRRKSSSACAIVVKSRLMTSQKSAHFCSGSKLVLVGSFMPQKVSLRYPVLGLGGTYELSLGLEECRLKPAPRSRDQNAEFSPFFASLCHPGLVGNPDDDFWPYKWWMWMERGTLPLWQEPKFLLYTWSVNSELNCLNDKIAPDGPIFCQ